MYHWLLGAPFTDTDPALSRVRGLTLWEQMDDGQQMTPNKKFLTAVIIVL